MKNIFIFLISITPLIASPQRNTNNRKPGELVINGILNNIKEPVPYIYMICIDSKSDGIDSVRVINNKYSFRVLTGVTTQVTLYSKSPLIPENIKPEYMLILQLEPAYVNVSSTDFFPNAIVTGSKAYIEFSELQKKKESFFNEYSTLRKLYLNKEKDDDKEGLAQLKLRIDSLLDNNNNMNYEYIKSNPSSLLKTYLLKMLSNDLKINSSDKELERVELIYNELTVNDKNSYYGVRIKKKLDSYQISNGMAAPTFVQKDTLGNLVSLSSFKGKYVLLDFWASWCGPCRVENLNIVKAFNTYKEKGFTVLSISLDRPGEKDKWMDAIHKDGLIWTNVSDLQFWNNEVAKLYKINEIPRNFLLDPLGKIIGIDFHGIELETKLKEILK